MITLYKHQQDIINDDKKKCGLFLGTGSAKTITALMLSEGSVLVVCPKTLREDKIWQKNLAKINKEIALTVISKEDFRLGKFTIHHYDTIIIDEADTVAGATPNVRFVKKQAIPKCSKVFDKMVAYIEKYPPKRLYLLTATPTRTPMCVWALAKLLGKEWNFYQFRDAFYFKMRMGFREVFKAKSDEATKERLGKCVRALGYTGKLEDYFDVPPQNYREIMIEKTKEQRERIKELQTEYPDPLVLTGKTHQVENGVLTGDEFAKPEEIKDGKTEKIIDLAYEFKKMVIFCKYTMQIEKISKALTDEGYKVLTLQGSTKDRLDVIRQAEESKDIILIIQSQISAGYELPSFPVMVFASMSYSVVDRIQAEGRILRANALKKNLYLTLVTKGGVDQAVRDSINNKVDFSERIYSKTI